jgi:hypothetical protein
MICARTQVKSFPNDFTFGTDNNCSDSRVYIARQLNTGRKGKCLTHKAFVNSCLLQKSFFSVDGH